MRFFLLGLGLSFGGGLTYTIYRYPEAGIFLLAGIIFLVGSVFGGGITLIVNRQWTRAIGSWQYPGSRITHSQHVRLPEFGGISHPRESVSDPWQNVKVIEPPRNDGGPVA